METILRKPNRLTLTPEKLLTPAALLEAEVAGEEILEAEEEKLKEVEDVAGFAQKPAISLDFEVVFLGLLGSHRVVSIVSLPAQNRHPEHSWAPNYYPQLPMAKCFAPLDSTK